ncbi:hypothetical protein FZ029_32630, partial [Azospirillum sp. Sh1]
GATAPHTTPTPKREGDKYPPPTPGPPPPPPGGGGGGGGGAWGGFIGYRDCASLEEPRRASPSP